MSWAWPRGPAGPDGGHKQLPHCSLAPWCPAQGQTPCRHALLLAGSRSQPQDGGCGGYLQWVPQQRGKWLSLQEPTGLLWAPPTLAEPPQPQGWLCLFSSLQLPRLRVSGWGLNTDTYVSCPGGWTPRLGAPANSAPGLQTAAFSPRPHEVETERGRDRSSHKDTNPVTPLPWPHLTTVTSQKPLLQIPSFLGRSLGA